jgi:acyl transferase domain-containing protein
MEWQTLTAAWQVPTTLEPWPERDGIRRASINNFGYGGSNAHVIMQDADSFVASSSNTIRAHHPTNGNGHTNGTGNGYTNGHSRSDSGVSLGSEADLTRSRVFVVSGKDERATRAIAENLKDHLLAVKTTDENAFLDNLAYTLGHRRTVFPWVSTFASTSIASLVKTIESGKVKPVKREASPRLGFVYTGQGAQWWAMGRELIDAYPVFKAALLDCDVQLKKLGAQWSMIGMLCLCCD